MQLNDIQRACTGSQLAIGPPVRGWREWSIAADGLRGAQGRLWRPGTNTTECYGRHAVMLRVLDDLLAGEGIAMPAHSVERWCTCGLYSWRQPDRIRLRQDKVAGVVESWGRVLIGERGYRAQYARVVALCGPRASDDGLRSSGHARAAGPLLEKRVATAEQYGVPYFETLDDAVTHFDGRR